MKQVEGVGLCKGHASSSRCCRSGVFFIGYSNSKHYLTFVAVVYSLALPNIVQVFPKPKASLHPKVSYELLHCDLCCQRCPGVEYFEISLVLMSTAKADPRVEGSGSALGVWFDAYSHYEFPPTFLNFLPPLDGSHLSRMAPENTEIENGTRRGPAPSYIQVRLPQETARR